MLYMTSDTDCTAVTQRAHDVASTSVRRHDVEMPIGCNTEDPLNIPHSTICAIYTTVIPLFVFIYISYVFIKLAFL